MNKNTAANLLHTKKFVRKKIDSPTGITNMPVGDQPGVISLPEAPVVTPEEHRAIKAHEYAHVALFERNIVPESFIQEFLGMGASPRLMNACMDAAVNAFAGEHIVNLPFSYLKMPGKKFAEIIEKESMEEKVCHFIQLQSVINAYYYGRRVNLNTPEHRKRKRKLERFSKAARESMGRDGFAYRVYSAASEVNRICVDGLSYKSREFQFSLFKRACERLLELLSSIQEAEENAESFEEELKKNTEFEIGFGNIPWGRLSVKECKLENNMPRTWKQRYQPKYAGSLRYMHRAITDMKVWGLKDRSIPPLAVLIDCSGSMEIEASMIVAFLEKQPASVIAGYSGEGNQGSVYVIGSNGKYATEEEIEKVRLSSGFGNIVDGPALLWLHNQKGRKIWICDGYVTSAMEKRTKEAAEFCREFINKAGIEYYSSVDAFFENRPSKFVNPY